MGNTCAGPKLGGNGFLQSVTAAVWKTKQPDTLPPPPNNDESSSNKVTSKSDAKESQSAKTDVISTPPLPVKMNTEVVNQKMKAEAKEDVNKNNTSATNAKPGNGAKHDRPVDGAKQNKPVDEAKQNKPEEGAKQNKPGDGGKQDKHVDGVKQDKPGDGVKQDKPGHMKRMSSAGLQVESVLRRKTGNLKDFYSLGRKLGQGQFGTTYLCLEKETGKEFACKSIAKRKLTTEEDLEDVRREIQIMHHLAGHPNVIQIIEAYEDAVAVHVVMDLCAGGELFDRIIQRGHYSERKAAELARVIVGVVQACHSLGVMHRDLKPENFLFVNEKEESPLKTIDFGLSMFFKPGETFTDVVGSPYYVAPEVLRKLYGPGCDIWSAGVIIYILLSGVPPFWDESEQGIFEQVLTGALDFESEPWPNISESAKDLVRRMLVRDTKKRLTAHEVLCHPWVMVDGVAPDKPLDSAVLSRLKQFSAMNKLKKMAIKVIAETLSEDELAGLREMFKTIDVDNSGQITLEELKNGLHKVGTNLDHSDIVDLMQAADVDNSGTIDYHEFVAAMLHLNKIQKEDHMFAAFSYFDKDGSGYITADELKQACENFGLGDVHLEEIIHEVDQDNDGRIDYSEFVAMMQDTNFGRTGKL